MLIENNIDGIVFGIQHFSIDDGPGIRTSIFLKGCNMNCLWCHNPESISPAIQTLYNSDKCSLCGECAKISPDNHIIKNGKHTYNRNNDRNQIKCANACPYNALAISGNKTDSDEIINAILSDKRYYDISGGGATFSGGEPLFQFDFLKRLLIKCKQNNIHTAIETNGSMPFALYNEILSFVDLFLFDYKITDDTMHKRFTGISNKLIISNLEKLKLLGAKIILRCPIIPSINDNSEHFKAIAKLSQNTLGFEIMPYHNLGRAKAKQLNINYNEYHTPSPEDTKNYINIIKDFGGIQYE